jgi:signal transduction histidine kinase
VDVEAVLKEAIARTARDDKPAIESATSNDPTIVRGDREALVRLFENLLGNAIRHTPEEGSVRVEARREGPMVAIRVRDTGEGIAPEHLPHLGERFYRVDEARARAHGGVGLGLAICRSIAQAHGGSIEFESRVGTGTTVTVRLPAEP